MQRSAVTLAALAVFAHGILAQDPPKIDTSQWQVRVKPAHVTMKIGGEIQLEAEVVDVAGRPVKADVFFFSLNRRAVRVDQDGNVTALQPGKHKVVARSLVPGQRRRRRGRGPSALVVIDVAYPELAKIEFVGLPEKIYTNTTVLVKAAAMDKRGTPRSDLAVKMTSDNPQIATVDSFGNVTGKSAGRFSVIGKVEALSAKFEVEVVPNPVRAIDLTATEKKVRTGDVVHFNALAKDGNGDPTEAVPVLLSFEGRPEDDLGAGASGQIKQDGRFVAEKAGLYTILATCGNVVARRLLEVVPRNLGKKLELVGHGEVLDVHTSDLWVFEGVDGRDYAVTGTWGANGEAYFWDVTNPQKMERISSVKVDARTVNDVKVSKDGKICIISRERASSRKNGIIILDVRNPRSPRRLATFTNNLTGGVHNLFIYKKHVYALSAGRRYDIINIEDPKAPVRVGSFELEMRRRSIHDVWVEDGIAYSSNWSDGVQLVDVGNGIKGGSPRNPVKIASYSYPSGWNHAAFPFKSQSTNKFYVIAGDETFPYGLNLKNKPTYPRGWFHFIDFTDLENPKEVARYEVPEAGTHNLWVEGDVLYAAYYNGGVRVVDISGELMGDLYRQGREIGWFLPTHEKGVVPNAPMVWGPQPHKGNIFFSDWNSGLWCVKIVPDRRRRR